MWFIPILPPKICEKTSFVSAFTFTDRVLWNNRSVFNQSECRILNNGWLEVVEFKIIGHYAPSHRNNVQLDPYGVGRSSGSFRYPSNFGVKTTTDCSMTIWEHFTRYTAGVKTIPALHYVSNIRAIDCFHSNTLLSW